MFSAHGGAQGAPREPPGGARSLKLRPRGASGASKMAPKMSFENFSIRSQIFEAAKWHLGSPGWPECQFIGIKVTIFKENVKIRKKNGGGGFFGRTQGNAQVWKAPQSRQG